MEESILQEVSKVFGLSIKDTKEFLHNMDIHTQAPSGYFTALLNKLPKPTLAEFPQKPDVPYFMNVSSAPDWLLEDYKQRRKNKEMKYQKNLEKYSETLNKYTNALQMKEAILINEGTKILNNEGKYVGESPSGQFGYVKRNKKSPYIYKFMTLKNENLNDESIKKILTEPLINSILQTLPVAKPITCEIFKVFGRQKENGYEFIYKLEDLQGSSISETFKPRFGPDLENNFRILLPVFGPLLEALQLLREKYSFEHGDLHGNNLMFVKTPNLNAKTNLDVKMIDFGYSSIQIGNQRFGEVKNKLYNAYYIIDLASHQYFPSNVNNQILDFVQPDKNNMSKLEEVAPYIIKKYKEMKGGHRGTIRRKRHKGKQTKKN
jgi:hypothetical protein